MGKGKERSPGGSRSRTRRILSARLPDGRLIETIYDPQKAETLFLVSTNEGWRPDVLVPHGDRLLAPYSGGNALLEHGVVLLASDARYFGSQEELMSGVRSFIHRYVDLRPDFELLAAHYVLLSWVFDEFTALPYLRVRGDYGSGKSRFLQSVGALCYKPIFASGASSVSSIFRLLESVRGTLVLDESDFRATDERAEIVKILNNGNTEGFPVLRSEQLASGEFSPRAFNVFGPKLIATRRSFQDDALESRCITEELVQGKLRRGIPLSLPSAFHEEARALRNKLLAWRFLNHGGVRVGEKSPLDLEPRVAQVFSPLLALAKTPEARDAITRRARSAAGALQSERETTLEADVLEVLRGELEAGGSLIVSEIARSFNRKYASEYPRPFTARYIGAVLRRRLFLKTRKTNGNYVIPPEEVSRLKRLFVRYGLGDVGDVGEDSAGGG